jgi:site-specific DNA-methyltransferase (adenine-specific)
LTAAGPAFQTRSPTSTKASGPRSSSSSTGSWPATPTPTSVADRRVQPIFEVAAASAGFRVHYPLVWNKASIGLGGGCWRPQHELIGFYEEGYRPGNRRDLPDVLTYRRVARGYPTQKPVALLKTLITQASQPGELVCDPFCGSGSTCKTARQLNRRALLCDVDAQAAVRALRLAIGA